MKLHNSGTPCIFCNKRVWFGRMLMMGPRSNRVKRVYHPRCARKGM